MFTNTIGIYIYMFTSDWRLGPLFDVNTNDLCLTLPIEADNYDGILALSIGLRTLAIEILALSIEVLQRSFGNVTSDWCFALTIEYFSEATEIFITYDLLPALTIEINTSDFYFWHKRLAIEFWPRWYAIVTRVLSRGRERTLGTRLFDGWDM